MGKGWAKGLRAASDPRVARSAAAHLGLQYRPRARPGPDLVWADRMAYAVGLMATDGCLSTDGRHLSFGSGDRELVDTLLSCLGRRNLIRELRTRNGSPYFSVQFGDVQLYRWFQSIGLDRRKSRTISALTVPDEFLAALTRGLLDGDGSNIHLFYRGTGKARRDRLYEMLQTKLTSGSRAHLDWLRARLARRFGIHGFIEKKRMSSWNGSAYALIYSKRESLVLLSVLYADPASACLLRKRRIWTEFLEGRAAGAPPGPPETPGTLALVDEGVRS